MTSLTVVGVVSGSVGASVGGRAADSLEAQVRMVSEPLSAKKCFFLINLLNDNLRNKYLLLNFESIPLRVKHHLRITYQHCNLAFNKTDEYNISY